MNFDQWVTTVPASITDDALWKVKVYQLALFASDIGWHDVGALIRDKKTFALADQLYRALGSIGANIAEGYSYGTGPNRARLYEYALGSARESRHWYYEARHVLGTKVTEHRLTLMARMIQLLLTVIPEQRGKVMREPASVYTVDSINDEDPTFVNQDTLLNDIPFAPSANLTHDA